MTQTTFEITASLDGFVAGPEASLDDPLGKGGMDLHAWAFAASAWREAHGLEGGEQSVDSELIDAGLAATGAVVMGRRMFSGGEGPWNTDPNASGWWGDEPPFGVPVFVVTHHEREPLVLGATTFHFVTEGVETAIAQAREAAGARDVHVSGGALVGQQALRAGLVDELLLHLAPLLLGSGVRLFENLEGVRFELVEAIPSTVVTHLRYRVGAAPR